MPLKEEKFVQHPAFGNIQISRCSGHVRLYDSPLKHNHFIAIRISTAEMGRDRNQSWHYPKKEIVEVFMSEAQFAQAITSMNTGGTPCTLGHYRDPVTGERVRPVFNDDDIPDERSVFDEEIKEKVRGLAKRIEDVEARVEEALGTKATKKTREAVLGELAALKKLVSDLPYIQTLFTEAMERTVSHARTEIVAVANAIVQDKGLAALGVKSSTLLGEGGDESATDAEASS